MSTFVTPMSYRSSKLPLITNSSCWVGLPATLISSPDRIQSKNVQFSWTVFLNNLSVFCFEATVADASTSSEEFGILPWGVTAALATITLRCLLFPDRSPLWLAGARLCPLRLHLSVQAINAVRGLKSWFLLHVLSEFSSTAHADEFELVTVQHN